jgi:hypothetical protein
MEKLNFRGLLQLTLGCLIPMSHTTKINTSLIRKQSALEFLTSSVDNPLPDPRCDAASLLLCSRTKTISSPFRTLITIIWLYSFSCRRPNERDTYLLAYLNQFLLDSNNIVIDAHLNPHLASRVPKPLAVRGQHMHAKVKFPST